MRISPKDGRVELLFSNFASHGDLKIFWAEPPAARRLFWKFLYKSQICKILGRASGGPEGFWANFNKLSAWRDRHSVTFRIETLKGQRPPNWWFAVTLCGVVGNHGARLLSISCLLMHRVPTCILTRDSAVGEPKVIDTLSLIGLRPSKDQGYTQLVGRIYFI